MSSVVDRLRQRLDPAGVGELREVDDDRRAGRDPAGDLDVEHDLTVGFAAGRVRRAVDRDRRDRGARQSHLLEEDIEVRVLEAAAKLEEADRLPAAVELRGEVVDLREVARRVADVRRGARHQRPRPQLTAVVEAGQRRDHRLEVRGHVDVPDAPAVWVMVDARVLRLVALERRLERSAHRVDRAREHDQARGRVGFLDSETVLARERDDGVDVGLRGAVPGRVVAVRRGRGPLRGAQRAQLGRVGRRRHRPHLDDDAHLLVGLCRTDGPVAGARGALAPRQTLVARRRLPQSCCAHDALPRRDVLGRSTLGQHTGSMCDEGSVGAGTPQSCAKPCGYCA